MKNCFVKGAFFQEMTHSGINAHLTLHIAQVLLRAGDERFFQLMKTIADLASPTGQWPEAMHPITRGGCMGDGQHVWAAAEWIIMVRNLFIREEGNTLLFGIKKSTDKGIGLKIIPIERVNCILAVSSIPEIFKKVEYWVGVLDTVDLEAEEQIFIYFVENGKADEIADVLKNVPSGFSFSVLLMAKVPPVSIRIRSRIEESLINII